MAKFLFIYRESTESRPKPSPEEMQALQAAWYTWMQKFNSAIVPGGDGLKHSGRVLKAGLVTDGPYVEAKEIIVSFAVIQADDYGLFGRGHRPRVSPGPHDRDPPIRRLRMRSESLAATETFTGKERKMTANKGTRKSAKSTSEIGKTSKGFTDDERACDEGSAASQELKA